MLYLVFIYIYTVVKRKQSRPDQRGSTLRDFCCCACCGCLRNYVAATLVLKFHPREDTAQLDAKGDHGYHGVRRLRSCFRSEQKNIKRYRMEIYILTVYLTFVIFGFPSCLFFFLKKYQQFFEQLSFCCVNLYLTRSGWYVDPLVWHPRRKKFNEVLLQFSGFWPGT